MNFSNDFDSIDFLEITMLFQKKIKYRISPVEIRALKIVKDLLKLGKFV